MQQTRALLCTFAMMFSMVALPSVTLAQESPSGTLNRYRPAPTPEDDFHLARPTDMGHLRFGAQLQVDYALNPLVYEASLGMADSEQYSIVEHQLTGTLGFSLGVLDRLVFYAGLPVVLMMEGVDVSDPTSNDATVLNALGVAPADGFGLGDAYLGARVRFFGESDDLGSMGLQVTGTFASSDVPEEAAYRGEPFFSIHPQLLGEIRPTSNADDFRIVLNAGVRIREETTNITSNLQFRHELTYSLGLVGPVWRDEASPNSHLDLHAQAYAQTSLADADGREGTSLEAIGGAKYFHDSGLVIGLAGGLGLTRGFGTPDVRAIGMLSWMTPQDRNLDTDGDGLLDSVDECPTEPEDMDSFEDENGCPDPDNDQDGILDTDDQCINDPENVNEWEDEDGCPDEIPDTDGDGLLDNVDQCINEPEDRDEFQDENGCPDPDNDGDGVLDEPDNCPNEAGPAANRGCPDTDRDNDTVVDRLDNCPDEPGPPENQGCAQRQQVVITGDSLEILDKVYFRTARDRIRPRSFGLLNNVAQVLRNHPEITTVRVEGHTDARGSRESNMDLSQRRAEAVVRYLRERACRGRCTVPESTTLQARGFGPDRLIVRNATTRDEHAQNRRVEFHVGDAAGVQQSNNAASSDTIDR